MAEIHKLLAVIAIVLLLLNVLAGYIVNRLAISEPAICLIVGVLIGPDVTNLVTLPLSQDSQDVLMREAARVTVAISVMAAALRLPKGYMRRRVRELTTTLTAGMMAMWLVSSAIIYILAPIPLVPFPPLVIIGDLL